jgi:hypothetical protein
VTVVWLRTATARDAQLFTALIKRAGGTWSV